MNTQKIFNTPLFNLGFRVFFALAGLSALILIVLWNAIFNGHLSTENYFQSNYWHAHEMLMGYSVAVISGFLLTAVKNWTGRPTLSGDQLAGLAIVWLYGRILPFYASLLPDGIIAFVDFIFVPALIYQISKPILQTQHYRSFVFIGLLLLLALGNGLIHAQMLDIYQNTADTGIKLLVATIVTLILILAGRVLPFFIERGLSGMLIIRNPLLDNLSIGSALITFALQLSNSSGTLLALAAITATISNGARLFSWYVQRIWYVPLLWILYAGYCWIILGFFLSALSAFNWLTPSLALHAFTVGGVGVLTLGMMARVSLGHTGRTMKASNAMAFAFILINLSVIIRVLLPLAFPQWYNILIYVSSLTWLTAFSLFMFVYAPMLSNARIDGQEG
ncbi:MAG: NnrS family protein [Methylococcales bacterium]|nr:NnrS family protein [Methylococcales bacterium]